MVLGCRVTVLFLQQRFLLDLSWLFATSAYFVMGQVLYQHIELCPGLVIAEEMLFPFRHIWSCLLSALLMGVKVVSQPLATTNSTTETVLRCFFLDIRATEVISQLHPNG